VRSDRRERSARFTEGAVIGCGERHPCLLFQRIRRMETPIHLNDRWLLIRDPVEPTLREQAAVHIDTSTCRTHWRWNPMEGGFLEWC